MKLDLKRYKRDLALVNWLVQEGGLQLINEERLKTLCSKGITGTRCPDGIYIEPLALILGKFHQVRHFPGLHGGAILLGLDPSKMDFSKEDKKYIQCAKFVLKKNLSDAFHHLKKGSVVLLISHIPCGQAGIWGLSLKEIILATLRADIRLTKYLKVAEEVVLPMLLIDRNPREKVISKKKVRLYVIKNKAWSLLNAK